jgi:tetratricopeptide (TPR) repeat protein/tRNA A-37 threonylcarbamoyl transferase component Bud32
LVLEKSGPELVRVDWVESARCTAERTRREDCPRRPSAPVAAATEPLDEIGGRAFDIQCRFRHVSSASDAVVIAFIERWLADAAGGVRHPVGHYEALFPGFEEEIRAEYGRMQGGGEGDEGARDAEWIGHYKLLRLVGEGGQGAVFEAVDTRLGRRAAVKVLRRLESAEALKRFQREAALLASFDHPRLCTLYEAGQHDGRPFIAMRFLEGRSLADLIGGQQEAGAGPVEIPASKEDGHSSATHRVVRMVEKIARALDFAHEKGVVHRDVKPANVVLDADAEPIVLDFGLARGLEGASTMTHAGDVLGTPGYLAPEHLSGRAGDRRVDVYALGVTLYECLTKRRPFEAPTREALLVRILDEPPPDPRRANPAIGRDLLAILETAMAKDPDRRYATARALADDLAAVASGQSVSVRRAGPAARAWQWARRHRTAASLIAVAAVVIPVLAALGGFVLARLPDIEFAERKQQEARDETRLMQAFLELDKGDPKKAVAMFEPLAAGVTFRLEAIAGLVFSLVKTGDAERALGILDKEPDHPSSALSFAVLRKHALEALRRPVPEGVASRASQQPREAVESFVLGEDMLARGHAGEPGAFERACDHLTRAVTHPGMQTRFHLSRAHALGHLGKKREAEARESARVIQAALPESAVAWYWSGFALHLFDPDAAIAAYKKAIELDSSSVMAHMNLAYLLRTRGRHEESLAPARRAVELDPNHPGAWKNVVAALRGLKRFDEIEVPLAKACEVAPDDLENWYALGMVRSEQGRADDAIAALTEAARLDPAHPFVANNLGRLLVQKGDRPGAEKAFRVAIESPQVAPHAAVNLAALLTQAGRHREAADAIVRGLRPGLTASHELDLQRRLAAAARKTGDWPRVEASLRRVVELDPEDPGAWCDLGDALARLHRYEDALAATRKGHDLGSERPDWKHPSDRWLAARVREAEMKRRVLEAESGAALSAAPEEALELASMALAIDLDYAAARFFELGLGGGPAAFAALPSAERTRAALACLRAGAGLGAASRRSWDARAGLRKTALAWLRAELTAFTGAAATRPESRDGQAEILRRLDDPAYARLEGEAGRAILPDAEWKAWEAYFADVRARCGGGR